jgi:hypothetical protein
VVAAVWGHAGIVSIGDTRFPYFYFPPDNTKLNLIAFKPLGLCSWSNRLGQSQLDALLANYQGTKDVADIVATMTALHNATVERERERQRASGVHEEMDTFTTAPGSNIFGLSRDYGRKDGRLGLKPKANKVYSPYGINGPGLLDANGYNPHNHVLVRLYVIERGGVVQRLRKPIPYKGMGNYKGMGKVLSTGDTTELHTSAVSGVPSQFTSDLLLHNPIVTLDQIVSEIKTAVGMILGADTFDEITVNLVDNNCNALSIDGLVGAEVISSPIGDVEMEDAPPG